VRLRDILWLALRYTLAFGRGHLSVFMSTLSIVGLVLGTAVLLSVLSVMNGFDREMRERILALVPHVTVYTPPTPEVVEAQVALLREVPGVSTVRPFVAFEAVAAHGRQVAVVSGLGLDSLPAPLQALPGLPPLAEWEGAVIGDAVARRLAVRQGDVLRVIVAGPAESGAGTVAATRLPVTAIVDTGTELDEALLLMAFARASQLAGLAGGASGLQVSLEDPFLADRAQAQLRQALLPGSYATTWRMTHGNLYQAISLSRDLVTLLLASIIGVAAFNVVAALVLVVIDKRGAIAILRTLGAAPRDMALVFLSQGLLIGCLGALLGCALGALVSLSLPGAVASLEHALGVQFLDTDVYPVSFVPVDLRAGDALLIGTVAVLMCVLAAVYPALRAARLQPARVLHLEP
jgi:lipoprotein-releasing system permease protein